MPIIEVKNISKRYRLGNSQAYDTLRDTIGGVLGFKNNIFGSYKTYERKEEKNDFWALRDVSFDVEEGEIVGIIGRNGAGKSTLLKILSRITLPTSGEAKLQGRVASLLEVGTGFSSELTGRENVYLNGSILGMSRKEINQKFREIVDFAEIEKFMDTPVKYYSSGMYTRLAFAVAAHLDPEILIVDEVLSVGDIRFQKKSLGRMQELTQRQGKTVLFVSHNLGAVSQLCQRTILLESGKISYFGSTEEAIRRYSKQSFRDSSNISLNGDLTDLVVEKIQLNGTNPQKNSIIPKDSLEFKVVFRAKKMIPNLVTNFSLYKDGVRLFTMSDTEQPKNQAKGSFASKFKIDSYLLRPGYYSIAIGGFRSGSSEWCWGTDLSGFSVAEVWDESNRQSNIGIINISKHGERS